MKLTIEKKDLITLIKLAQTEDDGWQPEYDNYLSGICRQYDNIHLDSPTIESEAVAVD